LVASLWLSVSSAGAMLIAPRAPTSEAFYTHDRHRLPKVFKNLMPTSGFTGWIQNTPRHRNATLRSRFPQPLPSLEISCVSQHNPPCYADVVQSAVSLFHLRSALYIQTIFKTLRSVEENLRFCEWVSTPLKADTEGVQANNSIHILFPCISIYASILKSSLSATDIATGLTKCDVDFVVIDQVWRVHQKVVHTPRYTYAQVADLISLAGVPGYILSSLRFH